MKNRGASLLPAWISGVVLVVVIVAGGLAATRLTIVQDITALLPRDDRDSVSTLAREWGLMKRVILVLGSDEPGSERLTNAADAVAGTLAGIDGVEEVFCEVDMEGVRKGAGLLMKRGASLYRPSDGKIDSEVATKRLSSLKERLASPEALVMQEYLLADPLGMAREALKGLEAAGIAMGATVRHGHLMSADEKHALVFVKIGFDPMEVHIERSSTR
jgi:predicted exporter